MHKIAYTAEHIEINLSVCIAVQIYYLLPVDTHILFYTLFLLCSVFPCRHNHQHGTPALLLLLLLILPLLSLLLLL